MRLESMKNVVADWRNRTRSAKSYRIQAEQAAGERDSRLLAEAFFVWLGRLCEQNLRSIVRALSIVAQRLMRFQKEQVALRHEDTVIFATWDKWKARTTVSVRLRAIDRDVDLRQRLPAITFEKNRLKRLGWQRWQSALAWRREVKDATAPRERRLLGES